MGREMVGPQTATSDLGRPYVLAMPRAPDGIGVTVVFPGFVRDAGMFAERSLDLAPWVGTRSAEDVADAVIDAIKCSRGEVDVAPIPMRIGATFASVFPDASRTISKRLRRRLHRRAH